MFKVNYRITDTTEEINCFSNDDYHIEGFFQMVFNGKKYGEYHNNPLKDEERGTESITSWFERLLRASLALSNSDYVAISDVESYNTWIELKKSDDVIFASVIESKKAIGSSDLETVQFAQLVYSDWSNEQISFIEMAMELIIQAEIFVSEVCNMNNELKNNNTIASLNEIKNKLKCTTIGLA